MAAVGDLSKVETPSRSIPQTTFNQETTLPRVDTRRDSREVNAVIRKPNTTSNAEALAKLLGVASDVTSQIVGDIQAKKDKANEAQAAFDYASGSQNADLYKNSRAYYERWQLEGAKAKSLDIAQQAADAAQEAINNPDATAEDVDAAIEKVYHAQTHDAKGNLLNFGTPDATLTIANSLAETKAKLMPEVHDLLRKRQNQRMMGTTFENYLVEQTRGAPIGAPPSVMGYATVSNPDKSTWGKRTDGSTKGMGFLGLLQRPDGGVSSEISIGVEIGGKETTIPTMVPGLTKPELDYLMTHDPGSKDFQKGPIFASIKKKAIAHAEERLKAGLSPFRQDGESLGPKPPEHQLLHDPLAPLPAPERAPTTILAKLSAPFQGFSPDNVISGMGAPRSGHRHNGEDFPVHDGTPISAPMSGTVIASYDDTKHGGGQSIRVKLANGAIVGFAHLSERHAQVGDKVNSGDLLGLSGHTGDATGPHVHMTVEVNGKKVSPSKYFATHQSGQMVVATGSEPQLNAALPTSPEAAGVKPGLDVEAFLSRLPPTISKPDGKTFFLQAVIAKAYQTGDASLLNGMENSKRPDGTPSFSPQEQLLIETKRDEIRDHATAQADKAKAKLQSDNLDLVLQAYSHGNPPSDEWLAAQGDKGLLDPSRVYTLIDHNRALRKQAQSEARFEERAAKADAEQGITADVNSLASAMMAGTPSALAVTEAELGQRWRRGDFGPIGSKTAMAHYRNLRTAHAAGVKLIESSPEAKTYAARLEQYKPLTLKADSNPFLQQLNANNTGGPRLDKPTYTDMVSNYHTLIDSGKAPGEAYQTVVDKFVKHIDRSNPAFNPSVLNRLSYLKCKQKGLCK